MPDVVVVSTSRDRVKLTIDGVEYEYETSYFHVEKFKQILRRSPLKALNHVKKNSYSESKTGRVIDWRIK